MQENGNLVRIFNRHLLEKINIEYVLFDLIGTTVNDTSNGESLIIDSLIKAFYLYEYRISHDEINQQRGKSKREAIRQLLVDSNYDPALAERIYSDFIALLKKSVDCFTEIQSASKLFEQLKSRNIKIGIGSGLPHEFILEIIKQVGWKLNSFDYIGSSEDLGKGRPDPFMIIDSMNKLKIHDRSKVVKIGDTVADIQEGKNAGVITACVLTGTQKRDELIKYYPDYIFSDINELLKVIL